MFKSPSSFNLRVVLLSLLLIPACFPCLYGYTKSGTVYTTNGSQSDVNSAIANAATGDTVNVPAGTYTWGANGVQVSVNKAITLAGAGTGSTTIAIDPTSGTYGSGAINISAAAVVRDFKVTTSANSVTPFSCYTVNGWRITNIVAAMVSNSQQYFCYAGSYGLIDNCTITGPTGDSELIFTRGPADSWQTASSMGTANAVYVEDCTFPGSGYVCDANSNARIVIRFCTIANASAKVDGHGVASNSPPRSVRHMEIYNNHWTATSGYANELELRGGTGMVFDNLSDNSQSGWFGLNEYGCLATWGNFNNTFQTPANYPIADQIGVGMDPKVGGSEPMYIVHNTLAGGEWVPGGSAIPAGAITQNGGTSFTMADIIKPDRDYFTTASPFDGSSGVGRGTKAAMQAITPTKKGVGFWVTNEGSWRSGYSGTSGQLYIWNGSAWVLKYTPYAYPHPLRTGAQTPPSNATTTIQVN